MNRGRRGEQVFVSKDDYDCFIAVLQEAIELFALRVSAYCLMTTHYHLLVQTPDANLSRCMRHINGVYTQRFNREHSVEGQLFRGRYKAIVVAENSYLLQLVRYIHQNPVRSGMVKKTDDYRWSSHNGYLSSSKEWNWLHKPFLLSMLARQAGHQQKEYRRFMGEAENETLLRTLSLKKLPSMLGDNQFISKLKAKYFERKRHIEVPESKQLAPDIEQIKKAICGYYDLSEDRLYLTKRAVFNEPRAMGLFLSRNLRGDSLKNIGKHFQIDNYSTVSSIIERFKDRMHSDRGLAQRVEHVRQTLMRQGQT